LTAERVGDREKADQHRAEMAALRIEEYVERVLAKSPPLTDEQRERIADLLRRGA
jgi:hypothetical protein